MSLSKERKTVLLTDDKRRDEGRILAHLNLVEPWGKHIAAELALQRVNGEVQELQSRLAERQQAIDTRYQTRKGHLQREYAENKSAVFWLSFFSAIVLLSGIALLVIMALSPAEEWETTAYLVVAAATLVLLAGVGFLIRRTQKKQAQLPARFELLEEEWQNWDAGLDPLRELLRAKEAERDAIKALLGAA